MDLKLSDYDKYKQSEESAQDDLFDQAPLKMIASELQDQLIIFEEK